MPGTMKKDKDDAIKDGWRNDVQKRWHYKEKS